MVGKLNVRGEDVRGKSPYPPDVTSGGKEKEDLKKINPS